MKNSYLVYFFIIIMFLSGCGQTNYLAWANPNSGSSTMESAQTALDQGKYQKAASILEDILNDDPSNEDANILYAESLMGLAGVDLERFFTDLTADNPVSNAPLFTLQNTVASRDRQLIYNAADIFEQYSPSDTDDKIIGSFCTLVAAATILSEHFDPNQIGVELVTTLDLTAHPLGDVSPNWKAMNGKHIAWISDSIGLLTSVANGDVNEAINEAQEMIVSVNALVAAGFPLPWFAARYTLYGLE